MDAVVKKFERLDTGVLVKRLHSYSHCTKLQSAVLEYYLFQDAVFHIDTLCNDGRQLVIKSNFHKFKPFDCRVRILQLFDYVHKLFFSSLVLIETNRLLFIQRCFQNRLLVSAVLQIALSANSRRHSRHVLI